MLSLVGMVFTSLEQKMQPRWNLCLEILYLSIGKLPFLMCPEDHLCAFFLSKCSITSGRVLWRVHDLGAGPCIRTTESCHLLIIRQHFFLFGLLWKDLRNITHQRVFCHWTPEPFWYQEKSGRHSFSWKSWWSVGGYDCRFHRISFHLRCRACIANFLSRGSHNCVSCYDFKKIQCTKQLSYHFYTICS